MADVKGVLTTLNHVLPTGLDSARLAQWRLKDGRSYDQLRADVAASLDGVNSALIQRWGDLLYVTTDDYLEYQNGGGDSNMPDITELDRIEPQKGETVGHMIDLREKGDAIGGTTKFFRDARESVITASLNGLVNRGRNTFEQSLLGRAMNDGENLLGTSGYDVGFASGSQTVTYVPPAYNGQTFLSSHDHYIGVDSDSNGYDDLLDNLAETVHEHGHEAPFIAYVSEADVASYRGLENYVRMTRFAYDRGGATNGNLFFTGGSMPGLPNVGGRLIGFYDSAYGEIELRATNRIPTAYAFLYKSAGINDPDNPLYVRVHPAVGFGFYISEIPSYNTTYPVKTIEVRIEYGISCGRDRTRGAAGYLHSDGLWVDPTIS